MMDLLKDKVCFVTGTSRGIGAAILRRFVEEGAIVYANARTEGSLESVCEEYTCQGRIIPLYFDITDEKAVKQTFLTIKKEQQKLDVLVNNAGIMKDALIGMINKKLMQEVFEVNVFAMMQMIQLANKLMSRQKSGSIINMASIVGTNGNSGNLVYSASKGAVIAMTKTAAKELASDNIRVNAVAPGSPDDIANACVFLASDLSAYISGQILGVDGVTVI